MGTPEVAPIGRMTDAPKSTLPFCAVCGEQITFYMHQTIDPGTQKMVYFHPACCPDDRCKGPR